jgi:hypothetical protein
LAEDFADLGGVGFKLLGESADAFDGDGFHRVRRFWCLPGDFESLTAGGGTCGAHAKRVQDAPC